MVSDGLTKRLYTMLVSTYNIRRPIHFVNTLAEAYPFFESGFEAVTDEESARDKAAQNTVNA